MKGKFKAHCCEDFELKDRHRFPTALTEIGLEASEMIPYDVSIYISRSLTLLYCDKS